MDERFRALQDYRSFIAKNYSVFTNYTIGADVYQEVSWYLSHDGNKILLIGRNSVKYGGKQAEVRDKNSSLEIVDALLYTEQTVPMKKHTEMVSVCPWNTRLI